ncbi:hypothetical protein B7R56_06725 [Pseudomonas savastanoi pv. retacarpa]|uniref:Uncharacterized protein n=4 Tax=Pseudomonas syringae group TaxID=136849 RepID=A0A3M6A9I4_PSESS|nr:MULTISPECIES: hypothetical protein [Pseudomonas syringae group]KPX03551.1 hypothetical protein ALO74_200019 [Pseudomonas syringae pv. cunninghamiae]RMU66734.1 hypothetical protein ALP24_200132 [Pseudomonas syringae pv. aptata]KWT08084.1 hypothetical protein AL041_23275 [Pseudomonas amygdali pv. aesculi]KWT09694.1 hypothetical protein AL041_20720 [Pseudomonas amygdali pv. aesculi]KWT23726.1 hypothetical protein AL042_19910 [Pseudomonas amygdali pv. aesculi]
MASYEIRLSMVDFEKDSIPEILVQYWNKEKLAFASYVTASGHDKGFDTVRSESDTNEDGKTNAQDNAAIIALANAFAVMNLSIEKRK